MRASTRADHQIRWLQPKNPLLWIVMAGFLIYLQTLWFDCTGWDDLTLLQSIDRLLGGPEGLLQAFKSNAFASGSGTYYRPLLTLSFMAGSILGWNALSYHFFVNIVLHLTAAGVLYLLLLELGNPRATVFLFSLLFTVHPALAPAIAWIPGRNDSLLGIFVLSSFLFFVKYSRSREWLHGFWHLIFFALALFTKEAALSLLIVCPLYLFLVAREKLRLSSYGIPAFFWIMTVSVWAFLRAPAVTQLKYVTAPAMILSIWNNSPGLIQYLGKVVFPFNLSVVPLMRDTTYLWGGLAAAGLAAALFFSRGKRISNVVFGVLFFLAFLLPSMMLVIPGQSVSLVLLEHRLYLPLVGIIIVMLETDLAKRWTEDRKLSKAAVVLILLLFAVLAVRHSRNFKEEASFWDNALKNSPDAAFVHASVAQSLDRQGRRTEAITEFRKALELNPYEFMALVNLANLDYSREEYDEAEGLLLRALSEEPGNPEVRNNLLSTLERVREHKKFKSFKMQNKKQ